MKIVIMNGIYKHYYFAFFNGISTNSKKLYVTLDHSVILLLYISAKRNQNSADASEKYSIVLHISGSVRIVISKPT
jgi:hypothetical protein